MAAATGGEAHDATCNPRITAELLNIPIVERTVEEQLTDRVPAELGPTAKRIRALSFERNHHAECDPEIVDLTGPHAQVAAQNLIDHGAAIAIRKAVAVVNDHRGRFSTRETTINAIVAELEKLGLAVR